MALRLLFNDLVAIRQKSGIGSYASLLLEYLPRVDPDLQILRLSQTLAGIPLRLLSQGAANVGNPGWIKSRAHQWMDHYLSVSSRLSRFSLYHEPDGIPLGVNAPTVTTVHDLSVQLFPEWHPPYRVAKYEKRLKEGISRTTFYLAVSECTKRDIVRLWGVAPEKIQAVHSAPRPQFKRSSPVQISFVYKKLKLPEKYLLFLGNIEPRKNVPGLLRAYRDLPASLRRKYKLVLAGGWGWQSEKVRALLQDTSLAEDVRVLGYLTDEDLVPVVSGATALIYPSFYEGFGLPPLEAMACDVPVITSHGGSLAEVVENAACIIDPRREEEIQAAIVKVLETPGYAEDLRARGRKQIQKFSWEKTALETAGVYRSVFQS